MKVAIFGANGRMGKELIHEVNNDDFFSLGYTFSKENNDYNELFKSDIIIDFSAPNISYELLQNASKIQNPPTLIVGTTGLDEKYFALAKVYKGKYFWASNTSLGIAVLNELVKIASRALNDFDIEIHEIHHIKKVDAPSGTALSLAKTAKEAKEKALNKEFKLCFNRNEIRQHNEIGISSSRGGNVAGFHSVGFFGEDENIKLEHNANSRAIFAKGALKIAKWLEKKPNGNYSMQDFINELIKF